MPVLQEYKCPCCNGAIAFDPHAQKMKCPYCDTELEVDTLAAFDAELKNQTEDAMEWEDGPQTRWEEEEAAQLRRYVCNSCGGEVVADATTAASECPFCGNPVVMMAQLAGDLRPDLVIPFRLDKEAAKAALRRHYSGKPLLPKVFKDENHIDEIKGVYVPFWLFDADAQGEVRYRATRTRFWSDANYNYRKTSYFAVFRGGQLSFSAVPVDGSTKMPDDLMESIEPFDISKAVDFQPAYLAGFLADRYDVDAQQSIQRANARIKQSTEQAFAATVQGYSSVIPEHSSIALENGKATYALYPVWLLNTSWQGKRYTFAMNGQTGKLAGDLPLDKGAFVKWLLGLGVAVSAAVMVICWLSWLL